MTRVAGANPRIWVDIFLDNREAVAAALAEHRRRVEQLEAALADGDAGFLARWIGEAASNRRRMLASAYERPGRACTALRVARPRPAGRARRDHAGARRGADQHRRLRAAAPLARARRHADAPRRGRGASRRAPPTCSRRRATASCGRRCSANEGRSRRRGDRRPRSPCRATSRSRTAPCCSARSRDGETRIDGFGRSARHGGDARGRARARRDGVRGRATTRCASAASACAGCGAGRADRLRQRGHADAAAAGPPRRAGGRTFELTGDESLSRRPMERIAEPLRAMGADVETTDGHAPVGIAGRRAAADRRTSCRSRARR